MRKFHLYFSVIALTGLILGTTYIPDNPVFWLASGNTSAQVIRFILIAVVTTQLLTTPPRDMRLRLATGGVAGLTSLWALYTLFSYSVPILDTFILFQTAIGLAITALERKHLPRVITDKAAAR
jgi:hypothetical protein